LFVPKLTEKPKNTTSDMKKTPCPLDAHSFGDGLLLPKNRMQRPNNNSLSGRPSWIPVRKALDEREKTLAETKKAIARAAHDSSRRSIASL